MSLAHLSRAIIKRICDCCHRSMASGMVAVLPLLVCALPASAQNNCIADNDCAADEYCQRQVGACDGAGRCEPFGQFVCPDIYLPVCGCDGQTYANLCIAAMMGVNIESAGECDTGCLSDDECAEGEYCRTRPGQCGEVGECHQIRTRMCPSRRRPVCGCDGETYRNACLAARAGVSVDHRGACESPCTSDEDCGAGEFCRFRHGDCGAEGSVGACTNMPDSCPQHDKPVCGCDGETYANACHARAAGMSIEHNGPCQPHPQTCQTNADCLVPGVNGTFCHKPVGGCNGAGQCDARPLFCPDVWEPVCGCDGNTYPNECDAYAAGVSIAHGGACDTPGDCTTSMQCSPNEFCHKQDGDCDGNGVCEPIHVGPCPLFFQPVCGCDGNTYDNGCEANRAGVSVAHQGICEIGPMECDNNLECRSSQNVPLFCQKPLGECTGVGECLPRPINGCPEIYAPVCGCDGQTYSNECEAHFAAVSVAYVGPCQGVEPCSSNADCFEPNRVRYCSKPPGDCGGLGSCADVPFVCDDVYAPVCGCDNTTYANQCEAAAAGVSVAYAGPCNIVRLCGGLIGLTCDEGEFCEFPTGTCNFADHFGACVQIPEGCLAVYDPVCGCDGHTYGNACEARQAQVSIDHPGECGGGGDCVTNADCINSAGQVTAFCAKPHGQCDGAGQCEPLPAECPDVFAPVCGCDGVTYVNECLAIQAGVNIDHPGACEVPGECENNLDCMSDPNMPPQFCLKQANDCHGAGSCEPRPHQCALVVAEVCGCDGMTYRNACHAHAAGVNVAHNGPCDSPNTCHNNDECAGPNSGMPGEFCQKPLGACEAMGECRLRPINCPEDVYDPACGCDGVTYVNECEARLAGASIRYAGECNARLCGGFIGLQCDEGEFCEYPPGTCNFADHYGTCQEVPDGCFDLYEPVCGCDGMTYPNLCEARRAQVSIDRYGTCGGAPGDPCTSTANCIPFDAWTNACIKEDGACDEQGVCTLISLEPCPPVNDPVCGCDGNSYDSRCAALQHGVSIDHDGLCENSGRFCGGFAGLTCEEGEYCNFPIEAYCGFADGMGVCTPIPEACPAVVEPVCGCDYQTHQNECIAALHGVSVLHEGECQQVCSDVTGAPLVCQPGQYCHYPEGHCLDPVVHLGQCTDRPDPNQCPVEFVWQPVCGCDGMTYDSECFAAAAGVSVAYQGICGNEPEPCETYQDCNQLGPGPWYCGKEPGDCEGQGVCVPYPDVVCPDIYEPVCGCDGQTYINACVAASQGMNIASAGQCGPVCGTLGGIECGEGEFCNRNPGTCNIADAGGTCLPIPTTCPFFYQPVCGCDGETYSNSCEAARAEMSIDHAGECTDDPGGGGRSDANSNGGKPADRPRTIVAPNAVNPDDKKISGH